MKTKWRWAIVGLFLLVTLVALDTSVNAVATGVQEDGIVFDVSEPVYPKVSPAVRDLEPAGDKPLFNREINPMQWFDENFGATGRAIGVDPLAANGVNAGQTPPLLFDIEGLGPDGYIPPDTVGDVGPNHYVQMVNVSFQIWDKDTLTVVVADTLISQLFTSLGGPCETNSDGDPIVIYDDLADRWMLSQFADIFNSMLLCMAVSTTPDPAGTYYLYAFPMPDAPDYPKYGAWSDGYYIGTNTGFPNQYYAHVVDRNSMLAGDPATRLSFGGYPNFLMPADADGPAPPPAGSPGVFYTMLSNGYPDHPSGPDRLAIYEFDVDWTTPSNSTFTLATELTIADYNYTVCGFFIQNCIPQSGTSNTLDSLSYWPMWRLQYRNFGGYEAMVGNFTVDLDGTDKAAIRWFELRKQGGVYSLYQEGTYAPDGDHRWMGSIAMDKDGNIALGYSVSGSSSIPAIRYTIHHEKDDPLGTMRSEASLIEGGGVQTSSSRWGDYSAIAIDPKDGCTFWYTNEYHDVDGTSWNTRIGAFKVPTCGASSSSLTGQVTDSDNGIGIASANIDAALSVTQTFRATTSPNGFYTMTIPVGTYVMTATAFGYLPDTISGVSVTSGTTTTQNFVLDPVTNVVDGYVYDSTTGWPLYTEISITGYLNNPIWTNPATGYYSVTLPDGVAYTFSIDAWLTGYTPTSTQVTVNGNTQQDFYLGADLVACTAPGYVSNNTAAGCAPIPGGLVLGNMYDASTSAALTGAAVANEDGYSTLSQDTPNDPAVDDGFYTLFSPPGARVHTATHTTNYGVDAQTVSVTDGNTTLQDFYLPVGQLDTTPSSLNVTLGLGY
ncbi:MAG: carboxypeptidase-like regulatory domain-containing protein, partial [Anaerolineales bacterium]